jgi:tetratricopeptide (TPR) repeat protein
MTAFLKTAIFVLLAAISLLPARADDAKTGDDGECFQKERAYDSMVACSRLLKAPDLTPERKVRIIEQRARDSLVLFYFAEAADDFGQVLKSEPENAAAFAGRAEALSEDGQFSKAAEDWERVAALKPGELSAFLQWGKNLHAAASYQKAVAAFEAASKLDKSSIPALIGLARALDMADDAQKSDDAIAAALAINSDSAAIHLARAEIAERRGNIPLAIESYKLCLKANGMQIKPRKALQRLGVETPP